MKFFEKRRVGVYIHGGKFKKDNKTGQRFWILNLVITVGAADVESCGGAILSNFQQIDCTENRAEEIKIGVNLDEHSLDFFGLSNHTAPMLSLGKCALSALKLTNSEGLVELWVKAEHECTDALHNFVKEYAFQRLWVEFAPRQASLPVPAEPKPAAKTKGPTLM